MLIFRKDGDHIICHFGKQCPLTLFMDSIATDVGAIGYIARLIVVWEE